MGVTRSIALTCLAALCAAAVPAAAQQPGPVNPATMVPPPAPPPQPKLVPPSMLTAPAPAAPAAAPAAAGPPAASFVRPGNVIGTGQSLPTSNQSSNITPGDTASPIAPRLPAPDIPENAPPAAYLRAARAALEAGKTGEGQEALERAESRTLDRSVPRATGAQPSGQPLVRQIAAARQALSTGDTARTIQLIDVALRNPDATEASR